MGITGTSCDNIFKIYNYTQNVSPELFMTPPFDINYDILSLHKKRDFNKGELTTIEYYGEYDFLTNSYSDLVLKEYRKYFRINEMVYKRELKIDWFKCDGTTGGTKNTIKHYTQHESYAAGERRRRNCITNIKIGTVGLIMDLSGVTQIEAEQIGWIFMSQYGNEIQMFVEGVENLLKDALLAATDYDWLDGKPSMLGGVYTIRQYLYGELDIDYTENNTNM